MVFPVVRQKVPGLKYNDADVSCVPYRPASSQVQLPLLHSHEVRSSLRSASVLPRTFWFAYKSNAEVCFKQFTEPCKRIHFCIMVEVIASQPLLSVWRINITYLSRL